MTQKMIRRFQLTGTTTSSNLENSKRTLHRMLVRMMNGEGFAPVLDINPVWSWKWTKDDEYSFIYTWQGIYVGKERAWKIEGVSDGREIPSIQKTK